MPNNSLLFSINSEGRVYSLSTNGSFWREFMYLGIEFKTLSAIPHFLWAVGGDRQIYVHVHGLEIPIRVREESFENERWLPLDGFSSRLLPTDRHHFSSQDGTKDRSIEKIRLPSMAWQWEGEWQLELTLDGQPLDHDGWSYAVDFPAHYGPIKTWKSCVRRRKWVRYRKYSAMNSWCAIAPLHKDPTEEPFIDVCIGGNQVPHAIAGLLAVWAITAQCRIMFRTGVSTTSPEGLRWTNVAVPPGSEVKQISVGPTGLVWALLWTGRALVRKGVTRDCLIGETWLEVRSPDDVKLSVISVGYDSVWALGTDNRVWFRKGINGNGAGHSEVAALGTGWLEIGGTMTNISVATNDQVFAVGELDKCLYWRNGITPTELTGKRWRAVQAPLHMSRTSSIASATSRSTSRSPKSKHRSLTTLNQSLIEENTDPGIFGSWEESHSAPTVRTLPIKPLAAIKKSLDVGSHSNSEPDQSEISGKSFETMLRNPRAWSPVRSVGSVLGMEAHPESDSSAFDCDSGLYCEDEVDQTAWNECNTQWTYVEAGGCIMDSVQMPHWFADSNNGPTIELAAEWRIELLESLKDRNLLAGLDFTNYGHAIEDKGWSRSGEARQITANGRSEECTLTLNWHASETMGTMSVCNPDGASIKFIINLNDITCVAPSSETSSPRITIFTPRRFKIPIKLQFNTESEYEDWLNVFVDVTAQVNGLKGQPSKESIWAVTSIGDILTWDSSGAKTCLEKEGLFTKEFNVYGKDTTQGYITELHNSFNVGSELEVKGCLDDTVDRFSINLQGPHRTKHKGKITMDVPFHFNPRLFDNVVVRNTEIDGEWGSEERSGNVPFHQGQEFLLKIVCCPTEFEVFVNGQFYTRYKHRLPPQIICSLRIIGALKLYTVKYGSKSNIVGTDEMVWRLMGGHLRQVETSGCGLVWGISNDHSPWVYTGGWGGGVLKGIGNSTDGINAMSDSQSYFVYENQRWNPLTGYCTSGLPTDRHMWSDVTGKYKRTRESTKLFNRHWHWISEWIVDYNTPGGVDSDGWQYATDFPAPYHGKKLFTDCVRRRRWFRRAQLITEGPWMRAGNTPLSDISLWSSKSDEYDGAIATWAITTAGDAVYRSGVTSQCPTGSSWVHVSSPQLLSSVSVYEGVLWTVGRKGEIYFRVGITADNPTGNSWRLMEAPREAGGARAAALCRGRAWVLLASGQVVLRRGITVRYPAGTEWDYLPDSNITLKHIEAGDHQVWGVGQDGALYRRNGICDEIDIGTTWQKVLNANFIYVSAKGYNY